MPANRSNEIQETPRRPLKDRVWQSPRSVDAKTDHKHGDMKETLLCSPQPCGWAKSVSVTAVYDRADCPRCKHFVVQPEKEGHMSYRGSPAGVLIFAPSDREIVASSEPQRTIKRLSSAKRSPAYRPLSKPAPCNSANAPRSSSRTGACAIGGLPAACQATAGKMMRRPTKARW